MTRNTGERPPYDQTVVYTGKNKDDVVKWVSQHQMPLRSFKVYEAEELDFNVTIVKMGEPIASTM